MRLLMLSWRGPDHPAAGGAEEYTLRVLGALVRRGHAPTWLCEHPRAEVRDGIRLLPGGRVPALYPAGIAHLLRHAREYDTVVDQINGTGFLAPLASPLPVLALIHQRAAEVWRHDRAPLRRHLGPGLEGLLLRPYHRLPFVTVSQTTLTDLRAHGWRGAGHVAYNGVVLPGGPPARREAVPTLTFLGRLQAPGKRLEDALAAFAHIRRALPAARLWVVGRGIPPAEPPPGVAFFPGVSDRRRDELLGRSWLLLATSAREGWGRMVLEAAAQGTTCAVYAAPGLEEAAAAVGGTLAAQDPAALARVALDLLRQPERLFAMGRRAATLAAGFSWEAAAAVWEEALGGLAAATPLSGRRPRR